MKCESLADPETIEQCEREIAEFGLKLERARSDSVVFRLVDPGDPNGEALESFHSELWTDLECARAAVRFARYFRADRNR